MEIKKIEVGQLKANCYLIVDDAHERVLIIDPGDDADYIQRVVSDLDVTPIALIATHGHFDHILAVTELKLAYNIPFIMHKKDEFLLQRMQSSAKHFTGISTLPASNVDIPLKKGKTKLGNFEFEVIETPGHTPGSVSLYFKEVDSIFVGDVMFADGNVGRTDFSYARPLDLNTSIFRIKDLPKGTTIYPGHDDEFVL